MKKPSFRVEVTQQWIHHAERYLVHFLVEREGEQELCGAFDLLRSEWLALSEIFYALGVEIVHKSIAAPSSRVPRPVADLA
jgi:hypothetical protein